MTSGPATLARNILSNWATFVIAAAINFFLSPVVVRSLGETQYGAWVLLGSMVGYLGLLDLGVRSAVTRYIATYRTSGDHDGATKVYGAALRIFSIAGMLAIAGSVVLALFVGDWFNVPPELHEVAKIVVVLGGMNVAVSLVSGVYGGIVIGLERFDYSNAVEIVVGAFRAAAVLFALKAGYGLITLAALQFGATVIRGGANAYLANRLYPQLNLRSLEWHSDSANKIFKYGLTAAFLQITGTLMAYGDSVILGAMLPVAMVTYFAIGGTLIEYARSLLSGISQSISPRISVLQAGGQESGLQNALLTSARLSSVIAMPIAITFILRGRSFIGLWMGPQYAALAGTVLSILATTIIVVAGYQIVAAVMFGINRHGGLVPIFLAECICNIILSIALVRHYGVVGTAIGTAVPRVIVSAFIGPWYAQRTMQVSISRFWGVVYVQPIAAMVPFTLASYAIDRFWPASNLLLFFVQVAVLLPLVAGAVWFVCLTRGERATAKRVLNRRAEPASTGISPT